MGDDFLVHNQCYINSVSGKYMGRYDNMKLVGRAYDPDPEYTFELGVETGLHLRYTRVACREGVDFPPLPPMPARRDLSTYPHRGILNMPANTQNSLTMDNYSEGEEVVRLTIDGHEFIYNKAALQGAWSMPGKVPFNPLTNLPVTVSHGIERFTVHVQSGGRRRRRMSKKVRRTRRTGTK